MPAASTTGGATVASVATSPCCLGFLINSSATELQKSKKYLSDELIQVSKSDGYDFLTNPKPSVLDCTYAADLDLDEVVAQLTQDPSRTHGLITEATRNRIVEVVKDSMTLEGGIAKIIVKNLSGS